MSSATNELNKIISIVSYFSDKEKMILRHIVNEKRKFDNNDKNNKTTPTEPNQENKPGKSKIGGGKWS